MFFSNPTKTHYQLVTDQMGYLVQVPQNPTRIISLVPSQTELLFELGLGDKVVGLTKFCTRPEAGVKGKTFVGGTKKFNLEIIQGLHPDLIIGNKEENYREGIDALKQHYPVWMSDINTLADARDMIIKIGDITGTQEKAKNLSHTIAARFRNLPASATINTAYFIWKNPYMAVGAHTFIHEIMRQAGFSNVFAHLNRYPVISSELLQSINPQLILLSSEPYPFREKHQQEFKSLCPQATVLLVDGELFSWYGSRLQFTPAYLQSLRQIILNKAVQ